MKKALLKAMSVYSEVLSTYYGNIEWQSQFYDCLRTYRDELQSYVSVLFMAGEITGTTQNRYFRMISDWSDDCLQRFWNEYKSLWRVSENWYETNVSRET